MAQEKMTLFVNAPLTNVLAMGCVRIVILDKVWLDHCLI